MTAGTTPSQTVGPFFSFALQWADGPHVVPHSTAGAFWLRGRVLDGAGAVVPDALVETWQSDRNGRFAHPDDPRGEVAWADFRGFGRSLIDTHGSFGIFTVKPGRVPDAEGRLQAPHLAVTVLARGLLNRVVTRLYFADEPAANAADPVLASLPSRARASTLMATPVGDGYRFDIHLQGAHETVFFTI
jgi:protocatechuate 3,4-dioxygenase alpha subunit